MSPALAPPVDLAVPRPGSTTLRDLLSALLRRRSSELRALLDQWAAPGGTQAEASRAVGAALGRANPGLAASLVRDPSVSVWLPCWRAAGAGDLLAAVAFPLALTGDLSDPVELRITAPALVSLVLRQTAVPPAGATLRLAAGSVEARRGDALEPVPIESDTLHAIDPHTALALRDPNPLRLLEAHPDKAGNAIDLGGHAVAQWLTALRDALALIEGHLPALRDEMRLLLRQVVPVGFHEQRHESASYQESIGTAYLTLHPNVLTMAEALIHEFSHNKLNALLALDPVLRNDPDERYPSPVRPDERPLHGVLLAVHAFVPVARLYERLLAAGHPEAESLRRRLAEVRAGNREGTEVLRRHARPTPVGAALLAELESWDQHDREAASGAG